jgi:predicted MFS family arabinose efflux permease
MDTVGKAVLTNGPKQNASDTTSVRSWLAVLSVAVASFAFVTTEYLPVGILPQVARDLHISEGVAGLMVTAPGTLAALLAPAVMLAAGRINRRLILLVLSTLLLVSNIISALSSSFVTMLIGRAFLGASIGAFWIVALAAAGRLVSERHAARASAIVFTGITLATVIGVPLGSFISSLASWRVSFAATAALVAIGLVAQAWLVPSLPSHIEVRARDLTRLLADSKARRSLLVTGLIFGAHMAAYTYVAPYLTAAGFTLGSITALLLGFGIIGFIANLAVSSIVVKHVRLTLSLVVGLMILVVFALPFLAYSHMWIGILIALWGFAYGAIPLCLSTLTQRASPGNPEAGFALFVSTVQGSIALGSCIGGVIVDHYNVATTFWASAAAALIGLLVIGSLKVTKSEQPIVA